MHRLLFALLLVILTAGFVGPGLGFAEEPPAGKPDPGDKPGGDPATPPDPDQADDKVPFVEEVNRAIELGVNWLKAKPKYFTVGEAQAAHWGLVKGAKLYDPNQTGPQYRHPAGPTALALYTLLKCGVDPKDPVIVEGFHWLKVMHAPTEEWDGQTIQSGFEWTHTQACGSYELSVMILALTAKYDRYKRGKNTAEGIKAGKLKITDKDDLEWLHAMVQGLVERRGSGTPAALPEEKRGWRYNQPELHMTSGRSTLNRPAGTPPMGHNQDMSSTQLATLALYNAHRFGVKVERDVWNDILAFTLDHQETEGPERKRNDPGYASGGYAPPVDHARGFMYIKGSTDGSEGRATGSMTACGIGNLLISKEVLCESDKGRKDFLDRKLDKTVETAINDGLAWLDMNWSSFTNPRSLYGYPIYYLYCVERAMDLLGKNLIGTNLWYTEGARKILDNAKKAKVEERLKKGTRPVDGMYWETGQTHEPHDVLDTCFALLFLKRATKDLMPRGQVTGGDAPPPDNR
jgi:hypothetical protein